MSHDNIQTVLSAAVQDNGTFTVNYPTGGSAGTYAGTTKHKIGALQTIYNAPKDFTVSFGATYATITWKADTTLPAGTVVNVSFDKLGVDDNKPSSARLKNKRVLYSQVALLDLGSPATADDDGVAASQSVGAGASFVINGALASAGVAYFDTPRNVVAAWTTTSVLTITGKDVDGNTVVEKSASGTSHTGKKAFKSISSVTSSASITSATVGTGTKIGLPVFVSDASFIRSEFKNGVAVGSVQDSLVRLSVDIADLSAEADYYLNLPFAGTIKKLYSVIDGVVGTADVTITPLIVGGSAMTNGVITITQSGSAAGDIDTATPTANNTFTAGAALKLTVTGGGSGGSPRGHVVVEILPTRVLDGTFVAGDTTAVTATTGDTRGTYTPSKTPDGTDQYALLAILPDPSDDGVAQYTG